MMVTCDGTQLQVHEAGSRTAPPVLLINAVGIPKLLVSRLMQDLAARHRVVTWDQRGAGLTFEQFKARPHDYEAFLTDVLEVHARTIGQPCPVVAVCSGAVQAMQLAARKRLPATALVLVSPAVRFDGHVPSLYETTAVPFMREIAKEGLAMAQLMITISSAPLNARGESADDVAVKAADRGFLSSADAVRIQAHIVSQFYGQSVEEDIEHIGAPVLIVGARDDEMSSSASVATLARRLPNCRLYERESGGHHLVFLDPEFRAAIVSFLQPALAGEVVQENQEIAGLRPAIS